MAKAVLVLRFFTVNGGRELSVGALGQPHDKIQFSVYRGPNISEKCAELYRSGYSLNEVARELGIAKSSVLLHLRRLRIPLRPSHHSLARTRSRKQSFNGGNVPYGYAVIRSQLVEDPKEMEVVRRILSLWNSGASFCAIAKKLNDQGITTRKNTDWHHATVSAIIRRQTKTLAGTSAAAKEV